MTAQELLDYCRREDSRTGSHWEDDIFYTGDLRAPVGTRIPRSMAQIQEWLDRDTTL